VARGADGPPRLVRAGLSAYRCVLRLYPRDFQARYADELEDDFLALSCDAWQLGGTVGLARWWADAALDAGRSLGRQWLGTPWIPSLIVSTLVAAAVFWAAIGRTQRPLRAFRHAVWPDSPATADSGALLLLMALMVLIPVAAVLLFWAVARLIRHEPPSSRGRA
jgi:hypothetical protein